MRIGILALLAALAGDPALHPARSSLQLGLWLVSARAHLCIEIVVGSPVFSSTTDAQAMIPQPELTVILA